MKNLKIENIELAPIAGCDIDTPSIYERFAVRAKAAVKAKNNAAPHDNGPEVDGTFQSFMGHITGLAKAKNGGSAPCLVAGGGGGTYPTTGTQSARLLATLLSGKKINPLVGWLTLGIYRLSDTVFQLRNLGWPVITGRLDVNNRFGEQCHVADYFLAPDAIEAAGDRGKAFRDKTVIGKDAA